MSACKILWVSDEQAGPVNGIVQYKGEALWFTRIEDLASPFVVPQPDVKDIEKIEDLSEIDVDKWDLPEESEQVSAELENQAFKEQLDNRRYRLLRLNSTDMRALNENHANYCRETGAPVLHGGPRLVRAKNVSNGRSALSTPTEFVHSIVSFNITGEEVAIIKQSEFSNYWVERRVVVQPE